jgi:hypothetical protein
VVVGAVALVAAGAWWLSPDGLTAEEQALVGTWRLAAGPAGPDLRVEFRPDRSCLFSDRAGVGGTVVKSAHWSARGDRLVVDHELSPVRRALRPVAGPLRVAAGPVFRPVLELVTADEFVVVDPSGKRVTWTRAPAD